MPHSGYQCSGQTEALAPNREKEQLTIRYAPMVKNIAIRLSVRLAREIQVDDLFNVGIIGLMDAIDKVDPKHGVKFETYAKVRIYGAMLDEIRAMDWIPRSVRKKAKDIERAVAALEERLGRAPEEEEIAVELNLSLSDYYKLVDGMKIVTLKPENLDDSEGGEKHRLVASDSDEPFDRLHHSELVEILADAMETLPEKERLVLSLYYKDELTMLEVGAIMGYTESRICQIHTKAIVTLRVRLAGRLKRDDLPGYVDPSVIKPGKAFVPGKKQRAFESAPLLVS